MKFAITALVFAATLAASTQDVEVTSAVYRVTEQNQTFWRFAYQIEVANRTAQPIAAKVIVQFLDSEGFEVQDDPNFNVKIPANGAATVNSSRTIRVDTAPTIKSIRVKIE